MKFSIIIPLYNGAEFIEKTLDRVECQTYKNYEVILVNDCSPDNVGEVVRQYINKHPEIDFNYIKHKKNRGLGAARNTAIKASSGEIIAILDQDDLWYPEKLAKVAQVYKDRPDVSIVSHNLRYDKNGKRTNRIIVDGPLYPDMFRRFLFAGNQLTTPAVTFKKEVIAKAGYFEENREKFHLVEDYDMWLRLAYHGYKFLFLADILGTYILHGKNQTLLYPDQILRELNVINKHYNLIKTKKIFDYFMLLKSRLFIVLRFVKHYNVFVSEFIDGQKELFGFCLALPSLVEFEYKRKRKKRFHEN